MKFSLCSATVCMCVSDGRLEEIHQLTFTSASRNLSFCGASARSNVLISGIRKISELFKAPMVWRSQFPLRAPQKTEANCLSLSALHQLADHHSSREDLWDRSSFAYGVLFHCQRWSQWFGQHMKATVFHMAQFFELLLSLLPFLWVGGRTEVVIAAGIWSCHLVNWICQRRVPNLGAAFGSCIGGTALG